jgi:hypothetical protein
MTTNKVTEIPAGFCASCGQSHRQIFIDTGQHADHTFTTHGARVTKPDEEQYLSVMRQDPNAICKTCANPWLWHQNNETRHAFNDGTMPTSETFGKKLPDGGGRTPPTGAAPVVEEARWPFDPVLRQALIDRGVITPEDLTTAEATIRAVTDNFKAAGGVPT